jgi:hypothetical protein
MLIRYSIHKSASMVGSEEDVDDDRAARLIAAGHATPAASGARAGRSAVRAAAVSSSGGVGETDAGNATASD